MKSVLSLIAFIVLLKNLNCQNTCYECEWQKEIPSGDSRCGWGADFTVPKNTTDASVRENCKKCAMSFTKKDGQVQEVIRICMNGLEDWEQPDNKCIKEPLYGGERQFCYCEGNYCNINNDNIDEECPTVTHLKDEITNTAEEISCYDCHWKKGESGPSYNPNCGWGADFKLNASDTKPGCGFCGIHRVMNNSEVVEVSRICYGPLTGKNYWLNHVPSCSDQNTVGGDNKFCYCNTEKCNNEQDPNLPNACVNPTIPPTDPPLPTYDCYSCNWHLEIPGDVRCGYGDDFTVPNKTGEIGVSQGCNKCLLSLTYRGDDIFEVVRVCLRESELGSERWALPNNTCSVEPLEGGKHEICFCEGDFCNEKKEKSTDCDSALIPLLCVHG